MDKNTKELLIDQVKEKGVVAMIEDYNLHPDDEKWMAEMMTFLDKSTDIYFTKLKCQQVGVTAHLNDECESLTLKTNLWIDGVVHEKLSVSVKIPSMVYDDIFTMFDIKKQITTLFHMKVAERKPIRLQKILNYIK